MTIIQKQYGAPTLVKIDSAGVARTPNDAAYQTMIPVEDEVASMAYENLDVELDPDARTLWMFMRPRGRGSFTPALLQDLSQFQRSIGRIFADRASEPRKPFDYAVFGSRSPGIFNLGGDLALFAEKIMEGDRATLQKYAHLCIDIIYHNHIAFNVPVVTMALVQGDALGGGFEYALSFDMIVAERSAKLGLPEILFNLFPGMGAYSFLSRRLDAIRAEKMILSGKVYNAEELYEMGIVDVLAEDGQGEEAVREYIDRHAYRHNAYRSVFQTRRKVNPVTFEELRDVTDIWVEAALNLGKSDLRKMARLITAQDRRSVATNALVHAAMSAE
jgi:DSF synthase